MGQHRVERPSVLGAGGKVRAALFIHYSLPDGVVGFAGVDFVESCRICRKAQILAGGLRYFLRLGGFFCRRELFGGFFRCNAGVRGVAVDLHRAVPIDIKADRLPDVAEHHIVIAIDGIGGQRHRRAVHIDRLLGELRHDAGCGKGGRAAEHHRAHNKTKQKISFSSFHHLYLRLFLMVTA